MRKVLGIEYFGEQYFGWQRQQEVPSVQEALEKALECVACEPVNAVCAGRTDAGVHATQQVVHFDTNAIRPDLAWTRGVNTHLPDDIAVKWVTEANQDFSARFSANARRYRYVIYNAPFKPAILKGGVTHIYYPLNEQKMHRAAQLLLGEHDFTSFRATQCQSHSPNRNLQHIAVHRMGHYVIVDIKANAFVHHMVRNIVGSLLVVGRNEASENWLGELLALKDRTQAAATAKPNGLYLVKVYYPELWVLPELPLGPLFIPDNISGDF